MTMIRMTRGKAQKLLRLLPMRYKPSEIAREIGVTTDTIYRSYLPAGAPCEKDASGNLWIVGADFGRWCYEFVTMRTGKKPKRTMSEYQAFCVRCNDVIDITKPKTGRKNARGVMNISGTCPKCGGKVNKFYKPAGGKND